MDENKMPHIITGPKSLASEVKVQQESSLRHRLEGLVAELETPVVYSLIAVPEYELERRYGKSAERLRVAKMLRKILEEQ